MAVWQNWPNMGDVQTRAVPVLGKFLRLLEADEKTENTFAWGGRLAFG